MYGWLAAFFSSFLGKGVSALLNWSKLLAPAFLTALFAFFRTWLGWLMTGFFGVFALMMLDMLGLLKELVVWTIALFWSLFQGWVPEVVGILPGVTQPDISSIQTILAAGNYWFPLDLAVTYAVSLFTMYSCIAMFRFVLKVLPGLGG